MVKMRGSGSFFAILAVTSAMSYNGFQAIRVPTENNVARVAGIIKRLELGTWQQTSPVADIVVPPEKPATFQGSKIRWRALEIEIMHEDLGVSIAQETQSTYVCHFSLAGLVSRPCAS